VRFFSWSIVEGITAALLLPITYSILVENYEGGDRAKVFGAIGGVTAVGVAIGEMAVPLLVVGVGLGLLTGQLVDLTMSAVPESFSDVSSGVINSLSQLGYAFGTAVAGSVQLSQFYANVVDGVTLLATGTTVSADERRQLTVEAGGRRPRRRPRPSRQAFVSGLEQVREIIQNEMVTAQQSVLVILVVFVLVTLIAAPFLPLWKPRRESESTPTARAEEGVSEPTGE
jgi:hypothetical protein